MIDNEQELALALAKIIHDAQDEHGLKTRHDIGLVVLAALKELGNTVGEKTIEHKDDYGGWAWDVLDWEPSKKQKGQWQYLVFPLGRDTRWDDL
jgi:hypothetical protein